MINNGPAVPTGTHGSGERDMRPICRNRFSAVTEHAPRGSRTGMRSPPAARDSISAGPGVRAANSAIRASGAGISGSGGEGWSQNAASGAPFNTHADISGAGAAERTGGKGSTGEVVMTGERGGKGARRGVRASLPVCNSRGKRRACRCRRCAAGARCRWSPGRGLGNCGRSTPAGTGSRPRSREG